MHFGLLFISFLLLPFSSATPPASASPGPSPCQGCETWKWNQVVEDQALQSLGKPQKGKSGEHRYTLKNGTQMILRLHQSKLEKMTVHFSPPLTQEALLSSSLEKALIPLRHQKSGDTAETSKWMGDPKTGRVWEIDFTGKIATYLLTQPWKETPKKEESSK